MADYGKLIGHRVISIDEGVRCGNVIDFLIDFDNFTVFGLIVKGGWNQEAEVVLFKDVESIGPDAVMVKNSKTIKPAKQVLQAKKTIKEHIDISKLEVITKGGNEVGKIATFEFNPVNGKILQFEIAGSVLKSIFEGRNIITIKRIISIGRDVMIVHDKEELPAKKPAPAKKAAEKKAPAAAAKPKSKAAPKKTTPSKKTVKTTAKKGKKKK
jgi:uncharacterized protein YrrD